MRYEKSFVNKLTDSLGEEYETEGWLDYPKDCKYIQEETHEKILSEYDEVRKMLISMINNPEKWCS
jgi:four helix bundle protein